MKRLMVLLCVGLLLSASLGFAGGGGEKAGPAPELVVQLMSDAPEDKQMVTDAINKVLLQKVNATVKFQHLTWTDWQQKYQLLITSGERVDVLYAANWNSYADYARDGAYKALDDLLQKTVPNLYKAIPASDWANVKIGGKTYAVPDIKQGYSGSFHALWRDDLRVKYKLAPITDLASLEKYLDVIKANEPSMYPMQENGGINVLITLFLHQLAVANPKSAWSVSVLPQSGLLWQDYRNLKADQKAPWEFPEYKAYLQKVREWHQKGYWSEDVLSEKSIAPELLEAGKTAATIGGGENVDKVQELMQRVTKDNPSWVIGEFSWDKMNGFAIPSVTQQDLTTIPIQSKYPEKALQVIEAFLLDKELQYLISYGIKGTHYDISAKNEYVQLPGAKGYAIFGMAAWAWKNENLLLGDGSVWGPEHDAYYKLFNSMKVPSNDFAFNDDAVKAELTACLQVEVQYGYPLWSGLAADINAAQATLEQKLKEAGFDKVRAEYKKQFLAYLTEIGL